MFLIHETLQPDFEFRVAKSKVRESNLTSIELRSSKKKKSRSLWAGKSKVPSDQEILWSKREA